MFETLVLWPDPSFFYKETCMMLLMSRNISAAVVKTTLIIYAFQKEKQTKKFSVSKCKTSTRN